ncbi:hypothetical protein HOY80DRAFT_1137614 [Tuber brumale]|nr:hypothetical protein HOY80DRAFT_1137614 [Tuber brumale]
MAVMLPDNPNGMRMVRNPGMVGKEWNGIVGAGTREAVNAWIAIARLPTPPSPENTLRPKLAGLAAPILLASLHPDVYTFTKGGTFITGIAFFSGPIISRIVPWQELLGLRMQRSSPLRIKATISPPPHSGSRALNVPASIITDDVTPEASAIDVALAAAPDS